MKEGVTAARIAAHAADLAKYGARAARRDAVVSIARAKLDWKTMLEHAFDPRTAARIHAQYGLRTRACGMCGQYCACLVLARHMREQGEPGLEEVLERLVPSLPHP